MPDYSESFDNAGTNPGSPTTNVNPVPALFQDRTQELMAQSDAAAVARATQEIQAALIIAQRFPRNEIVAESRILTACKRKGLAELAEYEYSRGGTKITGPTIDLLRAIANRWGNLLFGWSEVERQNGQSLVRCWAWDTQFNSRAERTFVVKHWRDTQGGGYAITDERDIYELIANMASRRVRACLEEVIDSDIVDKAVDQCRRTLREGETKPLKDRVVVMVQAFQAEGITVEMIEKRLGNKLDAVSENQLASLRRIFKSLKDGVGKREDYFKPAAVPEEPKFNAAAPATPPTPPAPAPEFPPKAEEPEPESPNATNPLRFLRDLAKSSKVKERTLLQFWAETMAIDGSQSTLEEVAMESPVVIEQTVKHWADVAKRCLDVQSREKKG